MKKAIKLFTSNLILLILLLLIFPTNIQAQNCSPKGIYPCQQNSNLPIMCYTAIFSGDNRLDYCCASKDECKILQANPANTPSKLPAPPPLNIPPAPPAKTSPSPSPATQLLPERLTCGNNRNSINTAIGCIPVNDTNAFAGWFLGWAIGVSGGLALLLIVFSGFQIMTAAGDPQKLQEGRELLTAAVSGLILIIFSIFLLRLIGVKILAIPGII